MQQLAGFADALNGLSTEHLADVLPIVAGVDAIDDQVVKLGVPVQTEYPENDTLPLDGALLTGPLGGAGFLCSNN